MDAKQGYLLLVEDDPDICALVETTLILRDYRVLAAQNGREALEIIAKERPAIVIADIMMPHLDGLGLAHRLRIDPVTRDIPVVFITAAYVAPEDREFTLRLGLTQFIQKPIDIPKFLDTIEELLRAGPYTAVAPQDEFDFYDRFRRWLEAKIEQADRQIARDEHLLDSYSNLSNQNIRDSLRRAAREREELNILLDRVRKQIEKLDRTR
ncbi:MAG: response regulator [Chloroflexi bacterium]|nr:response regulator [Chloroflexota bacterium]